MPEYLLPDVGEGLTEAEIVSWKVKVGDTIAINDIVCEIETAKSIVELPSPYAGVVSAILAPEGETIPVGTPIIAIGDDVAPSGDAPAEPEMEIDLSNPAASGIERGRQPGRPDEGRPRPDPTCAEGRLRHRGDAHPGPGVVRDRAGLAAGRGGGAGVRRAGPQPAARRAAGAGRAPRARQAAGAQARQGPRRRPDHDHADRPQRHGHSRRRRDRLPRCRRRGDVPRPRPSRVSRSRPAGSPASARRASRSRASAR